MTKDRQITSFLQTEDGQGSIDQAGFGVGVGSGLGLGGGLLGGGLGNPIALPLVGGGLVLTEDDLAAMREEAEPPVFGRILGAGSLVVGMSGSGTSRAPQVEILGMVNGVVKLSGVDLADDSTATTRIETQEARDDSACVAVSHDTLRDATPAQLNECAKVIANPDLDLAERATCAGAVPGEALDQPHAKAALGLIARSARDLFGSIKAASSFLQGENFDATGMTAEALLARGRGTAVIARLDELRYGTQG